MKKIIADTNSNQKSPFDIKGIQPQTNISLDDILQAVAESRSYRN